MSIGSSTDSASTAIGMCSRSSWIRCGGCGGTTGHKAPITPAVRDAVAGSLLLLVISPAIQNTPTPAPNKELEALHAHFERVVSRRHDQLFSGITSVEQWERRRDA